MKKKLDGDAVRNPAAISRILGRTFINLDIVISAGNTKTN